jgi:hypothetical protein
MLRRRRQRPPSFLHREPAVVLFQAARLGEVFRYYGAIKLSTDVFAAPDTEPRFGQNLKTFHRDFDFAALASSRFDGHHLALHAMREKKALSRSGANRCGKGRPFSPSLPWRKQTVKR